MIIDIPLTDDHKRAAKKLKHNAKGLKKIFMKECLGIADIMVKRARKIHSETIPMSEISSETI